MGLNLLSVLVKGSAYERGAQLGQKGGHLIRGNRDYYFTSWKKYGGLDEEAVYKFMRNFVEPIKNYDPEILEEIQGMADSAKLTLEDLMASLPSLEWESLNPQERRAHPLPPQEK